MRIRYCIDLDKDLHRTYKLKALEQDMSMRTLIIEALQAYLKEDYAKPDEAKSEDMEKACNRPDCIITVEHEHTNE